MNATSQAADPAGRSPGVLWVAGVTVAVAVGLVAWQSWITLVFWALDGALAVVLLSLAALAGLGPLALLRLGPLSAAWRWLLSAGLGIGLLATLTLVCGAAGWIGAGQRWILPTTLGAFAVLGAVCTLRTPAVRESSENCTPAGRLRWLWVVVAPFLALVLLVAIIPPGILWQEEGSGYDVLEYHLQLPKEYYQAGAIRYLPHNVYANFPANAEMLYLAACTLTGDGVESWPVSQCINALLAMLFVAAAWLACRLHSPAAGVIGGVIAASTGWLTYLSGVAYVENGMLFMGMLACACVLRATRAPDERLVRRWCTAAGAFAGLACGFKYPALVLIALPLFVLRFIAVRMGWRTRVSAAFGYACATLLAFSPWLIKNTVLTGNPVFPLLGNVFTTYPAGWGGEAAKHFAEAHVPAPEEAPLAARLSALGRHVVLDPAQRFGALMLVLAAAGTVRRRSRATLGLAVVLLTQAAVWLFATHLYARFAVPMLIPLIVLAAPAAVDVRGRPIRPLILLVLVGVALNLYYTACLYHEHVYYGASRLEMDGRTSIFTAGIVHSAQHLATINELPADSRILLVGEARAFYFLRPVDYCVVFNRNPFVGIVEESPSVDDIVAWLRTSGYTHVYVDWSEIARLRRSRYGFSAAISVSLFEQLEDRGVKRIEDFTIGDPAQRMPYSSLFQLQTTAN